MCFGKDEKDDTPAARPAQASSPRASHAGSQRFARPASIRSKSSEKKRQEKESQNHQQPQQGESSASNHDHYATPSGPPPGHGEYAPPAGPPPPPQTSSSPPPGHNTEAPSGPPPNQYEPPSGPPPSHNVNGGYAAPSGPPQGQDYDAPAGPPPGFSAPPGPPPGHETHDAPERPRSPANNASEQEAHAGAAWCDQYPLIQPVPLPPQAHEALRTHNINLMQPQNFRGTLAPSATVPGTWEGRTDVSAKDSCIIGYPPLYSAHAHSPLVTGRPVRIYYEVHIRPDSRPDEVDLALGFTALPYPNFRMPGWHRGSLAVHGDDGHKYVNDWAGGHSFTEPFRVGETVGIGMSLSPRGDGSINVDIFFTREGKIVGSWNLHEEGDAEEDLPVTGLEGYHDLSCAIGTFNHNSFEIIFEPSRWKYQDARESTIAGEGKGWAQ
ncbi:hypothetical protein VdG1_06754 [Verticillium dahliae VDG1]|nr:hypothetical protein VdG1_06754 [Verticillium dahliae VDG1]